MRTESKRRKAFGGTALTLLLSALVLGGSFLAAALMEYTIPRETDETVEPGDIREPVVYPTGDLKYSLYPWSYYDKTKAHALTEEEKKRYLNMDWMIRSILKTIGTDVPDMDLFSHCEVITHNAATYLFINEAQLTGTDGVSYTLDCVVEAFEGVIYFSCRPQATVSEEQWRYAYKTLADLFSMMNPLNIYETDKILEGNTESVLMSLFPVQIFFLQRLQWLAAAVEQYPMYRFSSLFTFENEVEALLTDSDLLVVCSGHQMNVLFIDPLTCRIIGCGSTP